jgi:serine O-acetyltransferase
MESTHGWINQQGTLMAQTLKETLSLIKADIEARAELEEKSLTFFRKFRYIFKSASMPIVLYRWQIFFYQHQMGFIASLLKLLNNIVFTVVIHPETKIGPGFLIYHSSYVRIGANVEIGKNCHLVHQSTIMASPFYNAEHGNDRQGPVIGDGLLLGCGASIIGNIRLGNNVKVAINSSVDESFPDDAVLIGVPARNVAKTDGDKTANGM